MKAIFFLFMLLISCGQGQPTKNRTVLTVSEEMSLMKSRLYKLEQDTVLRAKQVKALQKSDSLKTVAINNIKLQNYQSLVRHIIDSVAKGKQINTLIKNLQAQKTADSNLALKVYNLTARVLKDSVTLTRDNISQWKEINKMASIPLRYVKDSIYQWVAIKKLQGTSTVTQIPIIQSQIKTLTIKSNDLIDSLNALDAYVEIMNNQIKILTKERVYLDSADFKINRTTNIVSINPTLVFDPTKGGGIDTIPKTLDIPIEQKK